MTDIIDVILNYFLQLDWMFILTFILLASILVRDRVASIYPAFMRKFLLSISKTWRVLFLGIIYGSFLYWIRGYTGKAPVENMLSSLVFALVFHGAIIQYIINYVIKKLTPPVYE